MDSHACVLISARSLPLIELLTSGSVAETDANPSRATQHTARVLKRLVRDARVAVSRMFSSSVPELSRRGGALKFGRSHSVWKQCPRLPVEAWFRQKYRGCLDTYYLSDRS